MRIFIFLSWFCVFIGYVISNDENVLNKFEKSVLQKLANMENKMIDYEKENNRKLADLERKQGSCENKLAEYKQEITANPQQPFNATQTRFSRFVSGMQLASAETPAFYVYMSADRCIGSHEVFLFDVEVTDIGGGYSNQVGIFDVPITGTYVFTYTVFAFHSHYVRAELIVEGQVKSVILADSNEISDYHGASATVVLNVKAGDHVFIRRADSYSECNVLSNFGKALTSFSGWLLFA